MQNIAKYIDNAILKPFHTVKEVIEFAKKSEELGIYAVCVNPYHVKFVKENTKNIKVCSVVGFPLGLNKPEVKVRESVLAVEDGSEELDIVMNISEFKSGNYKFVVEELKEIFKETQGIVHKVIVETAYLSKEEKEKALQVCMDLGADFIKTSTGFAPEGAKIEDVKLFKELSNGKIKVKASGGIRDIKKALEMIEAGADRIGTSSGIEIVKEFLNKKATTNL